MKEREALISHILATGKPFLMVWYMKFPWQRLGKGTSPCCRLGGLAFLLTIQVWVAWTFVSSQLERTRKTKVT